MFVTLQFRTFLFMFHTYTTAPAMLPTLSQMLNTGRDIMSTHTVLVQEVCFMAACVLDGLRLDTVNFRGIPTSYQ
jgi:hypothetical protein